MFTRPLIQLDYLHYRPQDQQCAHAAEAAEDGYEHRAPEREPR